MQNLADNKSQKIVPEMAEGLRLEILCYSELAPISSGALCEQFAIGQNDLVAIIAALNDSCTDPTLLIGSNELGYFGVNPLSAIAAACHAPETSTERSSTSMDADAEKTATSRIASQQDEPKILGEGKKHKRSQPAQKYEQLDLFFDNQA